MEIKRRPRSPPSSSEAEHEPLAKRAGISSSSSSSSGKVKVCFVCTPVSSVDEINIFIVDLDPQGGDYSFDDFKSIPMVPTLRIDEDAFHQVAFCVLGSTLYAFEGYEMATGYRRNSVHTFEIPPGASDLKLERSMFKNDEVPSMYAKLSPEATPTPDGKILVCSSRIACVPSRYGDAVGDICDFELYDPVCRSWSKLPGLFEHSGIDDFRGSRTFVWMKGMSFMNDIDEKKQAVSLLVQTEIGIFALNLQEPWVGWVKWSDFYGAPGFPRDSGFFSVILKDLCLAPSCAYDLAAPACADKPEEREYDIFFRAFYYDNFFRAFHFPNSSSFPADADYICPTRLLTLLDYDVNKYCNFCILQTGMNSKTLHAHVMIDVYTCNLVECQKELLKYRLIDQHMEEVKLSQLKHPLPGTTLVKSFKFHLAEEWDEYIPLSFFSIPAGIV